MNESFKKQSCRPYEDVPKTKGTYLLFLEVKKDITTSIGSLGLNRLKKGLYVYVGSALGPGGLRARIDRHLKRDKKLKWHIDYLTANPNVEIREIVVFKSKEKLECLLSKTVLENNGDVVIPKFGSTDCDCPSHLIKIDDKEKLKAVLRSLVGKLEVFCQK